MNMPIRKGGGGARSRKPSAYQRWCTVMVPQTLHQTLIPSLRGGTPAMLMLAPHVHFTMFSMIVARCRCFMK